MMGAYVLLSVQRAALNRRGLVARWATWRISRSAAVPPPWWPSFRYDYDDLVLLLRVMDEARDPRAAAQARDAVDALWAADPSQRTRVWATLCRMVADTRWNHGSRDGLPPRGGRVPARR